MAAEMKTELITYLKNNKSVFSREQFNREVVEAELVYLTPLFCHT